MKGKYIILELIPSHSNPENGSIIQLQALKLDGLMLLDRFDYRLREDLIINNDLREMVSYDKDMFHYVDDSIQIVNDFKKWIGKMKLLIIDNYYTMDYLKDFNNKKESIFKYLDLEFSDDIIDKVISKYQLEPSNHIVDLLYEALINESNKKK